MLFELCDLYFQTLDQVRLLAPHLLRLLELTQKKLEVCLEFLVLPLVALFLFQFLDILPCFIVLLSLMIELCFCLSKLSSELLGCCKAAVPVLRSQ